MKNEQQKPTAQTGQQPVQTQTTTANPLDCIVKPQPVAQILTESQHINAKQTERRKNRR